MVYIFVIFTSCVSGIVFTSWVWLHITQQNALFVSALQNNTYIKVWLLWVIMLLMWGDLCSHDYNNKHVIKLSWVAGRKQEVTSQSLMFCWLVIHHNLLSLQTLWFFKVTVSSFVLKGQES